MSLITCIAVDDEPLALEVIERFAKKTSMLQLVATFENPLDAVSYLNENEIDLIYLDINMPDLNGISLIKSLQHRPLIVFTTAHAEYALQGYELDVLDYLLKPIEFDRFIATANKAYKRLGLDKKVEQIEIQDYAKDYLFVKSDTRFFKVNYEDILYIEGMRDYVAIHTAESKILSLMSMSKILEKLPSRDFKRVHKSYIVNLSHISLVQNNRIKLCGREIPISNSYRDEFLKIIGESLE